MGSRFRGSEVHIKFDPLICELRDLPRQCHVTAGRKARESNLIAYEQYQQKNVTLNGEL